MLNWNLSPDDRTMIRAIAERAWKEIKNVEAERTVGDVQMDLAACHLNGCPLDLAKLLEADAYTLTHDILGIAAYLDRTTGALTDHFSPRCAVPASVVG